MKKKLIIYNVVLTVVVLALMFGLGLLVTKNNYAYVTEKKIKEITAVYAANYSDGITFPADDDVRVTVIAADGRVLKDSSGQESYENHIDRPEIKAARDGKPAVSVRRSETLNKEMMYYAEKVAVGDSAVFIRVAIPTESINGYALKSIIPMLAILLGVWIISTVASILLSGVLLKPLRQVKNGLTQIDNGTYQKVIPATDDEDVNQILSGINDLAEKLQANMQAAKSERKKLDYVLCNVSDGIAVFDGELNVEIANDAAKKIFGTSEPEGKHIEVLTADRTFIEYVENCARNKSDALFTFEANGAYYLTSVRYTDSDMIIAVLSDITQTKENEKMRLEFFANASHELKTPLTAIKGFNDMIALKEKDAEISDYSARISKEIDRVINLLGDMLDLSKLDNSALKHENLTEVELSEVSLEVKEALNELCRQKDVKINVDGSGVVTAEREHIYELIKNLAENGVRYGNAGGKVDIEISEEKGKVKLTVADDGIGIDAKHQSRIFERFYRVDKSRSRATGGTGLGLAIVKHICGLYNADLSLKSTLGAGTTIEVVFG